MSDPSAVQHAAHEFAALAGGADLVIANAGVSIGCPAGAARALARADPQRSWPLHSMQHARRPNVCGATGAPLCWQHTA